MDTVELLGLLSPTPQKPPIPIFSSSLSCGFPSPAEEFVEHLTSLDEIAINCPSATFLVRAGGDSMIDAGIFEGDIIVVDRSKTAKHGNIVVAVVEGRFTCKRIIFSGSQISLKPENKIYSPISISTDSEFYVWGVCTHNLHKLCNI